MDGKEPIPQATQAEIITIDPRKQAKWDEVTQKMDTTTDRLGMPIDPGIKEAVIAFNVLGYTTGASCEGHLDHGAATPWIDFDKSDRNSELFKQRWNAYQALHSAQDNNAPKDEIFRLRRKADALDREYRTPAIKEAGKLMEILGEFYKDRQVSEDVRLRVDFLGLDVVRMECSGNFLQEIADQETRARKLKEYQAEMAAFSSFLKNKFFNEPQPLTQT